MVQLWARLSKGPHVREPERRGNLQDRLMKMSKYHWRRMSPKYSCCHVGSPDPQGRLRVMSKYHWLRMMSKYSCGRALSKGPHVREPERRGWPRLLSKYSRLNEGVGRPGRTKYLVKRLMKRPSRQA